MSAEILSNEIPTTPLEADLIFWQERLDRLASEAPDIAGTNEYPEWYHQGSERLRDIPHALHVEGVDLSNVSKYFQLSVKEAELRSVITGYPLDNPPLHQVVYNLGEDLAGQALIAEPEDGPIRVAVLGGLRNAANSNTGFIGPEIDVLKKAYGLQKATELLGSSDDTYRENVRDLLLNEQTIRWIRHQDEERSPDFEWRDTQAAMCSWMAQAVEAATGMPKSEASDYVYTASRRNGNEDIIGIIKKFDYFGVDRIREISRTTGIHGLEAYSIEQLERMEEFSRDPKGVSERLQEHDVITVMVNRVGDHNGVMGNVAEDFDDDKGRVLFFEINRIGDIYRWMATLKKAGIKPSTLVLASHSAPGQFMVCDSREIGAQRRDIATVVGRKLVAVANSSADSTDGDYGFSMQGMRGMARLVDDYMQPSRSIDDATEDLGRKKIIFQACHAASEVKVGDLDTNGDRIETGMDSVVGQLGSDLIASGAKTKVDIYGAPGGIQMLRNSRGVHYTGHPSSSEDSALGRSARPHLEARRIRVENGTLKKSEVQDIPLRN